jgi:hypothetical protein
MFKSVFNRTPQKKQISKESISSPFGMKLTGIVDEIEANYNKINHDMYEDMSLDAYDYGGEIETPSNDLQFAYLELKTGQELLDKNYYNSQAKVHFKNGVDILLKHADDKTKYYVKINDYLGLFYEKIAEVAMRENDNQSVISFLTDAKNVYEKTIQMYSTDKDNIISVNMPQNTTELTTHPDLDTRWKELTESFDGRIGDIQTRLEAVNQLIQEYSSNKQGGKKRSNRRTIKRKASGRSKSRKVRK